jgi:hypothetical protein
VKDPLRKVVYIFETEGDQGGGYWQLVLECGHAAARHRNTTTKDPLAAMVRLTMFRPMSGLLAPKRVRCFSCGLGHAKADPAILIAAFGGPKL